MFKDYMGREHESGCHFDCRIPDCGCAGDCNCESIREYGLILNDEKEQ
jgi:hypothetical protein